ncbi:CDP-glycerol glycerophosphotransferase family protein [Paenibacillus timonensis]|uniref:CDP-glycerol glycerophosphotransferase family protein n=1 Tax=Paenibacillus timonensis TaxID=225915 RepID=UPI0022E74E67|nr:CDP-glycerol glycerophosphotransferase family protein [Paenibacillus timonensis]
MEAIVFGSGVTALTFINSLDRERVKIKYIIDNNPEKHHTKIQELTIYPVDRAKANDFDVVFLASFQSLSMMAQLLEMGIAYDKIIPVNHEEHTRALRENYQKVLNSAASSRRVSNRKKIALVNLNYSNYQGLALFRYMPLYIKEKYDVDLIDASNYAKLSEYDVICSSHFDGIYQEGFINIELWHGFPLKTMGLLSPSINDNQIKSQDQRSKNTALVMSYSHLYNTFFNACFPYRQNKYRITGMPRNDFLFEEDGKEKLESLFGISLRGSNVIFYLPTWREGKKRELDSSMNWDHIFGTVVQEDSFTSILSDTNSILFVKLHPHEYRVYDKLGGTSNERIFYITDDMLSRAQVHLYELLNCADALITDYSSVAYDLLLKDVPLIYYIPDEMEYSNRRGFLIEPYSQMLPGPQVSDISMIGFHLHEYSKNKDYYRAERETVRDLIFKYKDNKASQRVWKEIDNYISQQDN